jgi:lysozyme
MPAACPTTQPKASLAEIERLILPLQKHPNYRATDKVACVIIRGYRRDTMGKAGRNDVGMYDDAAFWLAGDHFSAWNANSDPSRLGWNQRAGQYMARLRPGVWRFRRWKHKGQYAAFGQGGNPVSIDRVRQDGTIAKTVKGCFGINLHKGGVVGTSSEGCLTIPISHWLSFQSAGYDLLDRHGIAATGTFPLFLIERPDA